MLNKGVKVAATGVKRWDEETDLDEGKIRIVHNKLLGGWYVVRRSTSTPIGGRHDSKEAAKAHLQNKKMKEINQRKVSVTSSKNLDLMLQLKTTSMIFKKAQPLNSRVRHKK